MAERPLCHCRAEMGDEWGPQGTECKLNRVRVLLVIPKRWIQGFQAQDRQGQVMLEFRLPLVQSVNFSKAELMTNWLGQALTEILDM